MKRLTLSAFIAVLVVSTLGWHPGRVPSRASAAGPTVVLESTGFEANEYTVDEPLDGQQGWVAIAGSEAIQVSSAGANHGDQCVSIWGGLVVPTTKNFLEAFAGTYVLYDPVASGTPVMHLRTSARLDGPDTGHGAPMASQVRPHMVDAQVSANFYTATTAGENLGAFYVSSDGYVYGSAGGGPYFAFSVPYERGTYVDLDLVLDFNAGTTTFVVDGAPIGVAPMYPEPLRSTTIIAVPLELNIQRGPVSQDHRALYTAYFDDYSVTAGIE